tara:strand:+ start:22220 stop:22327 length:108 start_codon:yes stop_codon:yes gene_type:complete
MKDEKATIAIVPGHETNTAFSANRQRLIFAFIRNK